MKTPAKNTTHAIEAPDFAMHPAGLKNGTIFMRRSIETVAAERKAEQIQAAAAAQAAAETAKATGQTPLIVGEETPKSKGLPPDQWGQLQDIMVVVHAENKPFRKVFEDVVAEAAPYVGPWQVQWRLTDEDATILDERFNLNAETQFSRFVDYLSHFVLNYRGFSLKFSMFETERIIVVSDK